MLFYCTFSGDKLGLPRPPAVLDPSLTEEVILENGVNYASGGGGILNETGSYFVSCEFQISLAYFDKLIFLLNILFSH